MFLFYSGSLSTFIILILMAFNLLALALGFYGVHKHKFKGLMFPLVSTLITVVIGLFLACLNVKINTSVGIVTAFVLAVIYIILLGYAGYIKFKQHRHN